MPVLAAVSINGLRALSMNELKIGTGQNQLKQGISNRTQTRLLSTHIYTAYSSLSMSVLKDLDRTKIY